MTDFERIVGRIEAAHTLQRLKLQKHINLEDRIELHSECGGRGYLEDQSSCLYCHGTGRVRVLEARVTIPFDNI